MCDSCVLWFIFYLLFVLLCFVLFCFVLFCFVLFCFVLCWFLYFVLVLVFCVVLCYVVLSVGYCDFNISLLLRSTPFNSLQPHPSMQTLMDPSTPVPLPPLLPGLPSLSSLLPSPSPPPLPMPPLSPPPELQQSLLQHEQPRSQVEENTISVSGLSEEKRGTHRLQLKLEESEDDLSSTLERSSPASVNSHPNPKHTI